MSQAIYDLAHDELGSLSIFLVPIGRRDDRTLYQAVFTWVD